jgi:hypothetical protein
VGCNQWAAGEGPLNRAANRQAPMMPPMIGPTMGTQRQAKSDPFAANWQKRVSDARSKVTRGIDRVIGGTAGKQAD